jgi:hypothetical protein
MIYYFSSRLPQRRLGSIHQPNNKLFLDVKYAVRILATRTNRYILQWAPAFAGEDGNGITVLTWKEALDNVYLSFSFIDTTKPNFERIITC